MLIKAALAKNFIVTVILGVWYRENIMHLFVSIDYLLDLTDEKIPYARKGKR